MNCDIIIVGDNEVVLVVSEGGQPAKIGHNDGLNLGLSNKAGGISLTFKTNLFYWYSLL